MENPTLSRHPNMLSKKTYNGFTTAPSKAIYDDVFGGGPKFGAPALSPRVEDYAEIFGGFRTSRAASIPVLDLPLVDDQAADVCFDVRGSGFDYAEVFGGFDGRNFAVSYEELLRTMEQANGLDDSSNEAWTPAEVDNLSDESDHSAKHQRFSNGDSSESIDGYTEFSISYNEAGQNCNEKPSNGVRHTTQLHDPSGYTFVVDKATSLPNSDSLYSRDNGAHHIIDYNGEILGQRHLRKAMSQPAKSSNGPFFGDDVKPHGEFVRSGSMFKTISDVSLRTRPSDLPPPSRPPPALFVEKGYSDKTTPSCRSVASEGSAGENSPPYFDVEVDASSSAAASAAAMKDAMKKAQAKLKSAKESMERKQEAFHIRRNSDSKILRRNKEEKATKLINGFGSVRGEGLAQGVLQGGEENVIEFSFMDEKHELKKTSQLFSDPVEGNYSLNMVKKSAKENKGTESLSSQGSDFINVNGEWKEASQFFELVTNESKKVLVQENNKTVLEQDSKCCDHQKKEKRANAEGLQGHRENGVKVGAGCELEFLEMTSGIPIRAFECDNSSERSEMANKQQILDKRVQITDEPCREERNEKKFSPDLRPGENGKGRIKVHDLKKHSKSEKADRHKDKGTQFEENNRNLGNVKKSLQGKEESGMRSRDTLRFGENEKKFDVTTVPAETEIKMLRVTAQEEKERTKKVVLEWGENEKTLRESAGWKVSERLQKETLEKEDKEKRLKEKCQNEERLRRQKEAAEQEEDEKRRKEIREREENEKKRSEMLEREANEKRLKEARDKEENERRLKENLEKEERKRMQIKAIEQEEKVKRQREENEKRRKQALEKEEMQRRQREAILKEENENRERLENERRLKQALEKEEMQRKQREVAEQENAKREREEIFERIKEPLESERVERKEEVCLKPENGGLEKSSKLLFDLRNVEVAAVFGPEQKTNEKIKRRQVDLDAGYQGLKPPRERNDLMSDGAVKKRDESGRKGAQPATEVKGSNHRADQQLHRSQSTTQKGKNDTLQQEDGESERMKRERDMELERLRKMEEEREREREREKDRMAVDRTILETRERVYAERATMERTTAEVRQRALNDARERLEKACAEAKEKSFPDNKASVESRIRAERAAVERATAEARERAFEKAMAERNAFERSASDKFSASSRNGGFRPNSASYELHNQQSQVAGFKQPHITPKGSNHQYSSVYTERFGAEGESPQRCKARLERHRRTAERAANALEELNMRDLHAQQEQAERNRLAETLDAEVKRWSSGKEGNLRALLSTLQYILGPGSGWQPIHLTEVITAAAVKKAYRKATLCVHPDKLQQRGATIQQKYICEKVFDLLKEAWNRFNSEER